MSLWLNKKKKPELVALCEQLDLEFVPCCPEFFAKLQLTSCASFRTVGYRKTELEAILAEYLDSHESELASDPAFSSYYDSLHSRSPVKGASAAAIALDVSEKRTRRTPRRYGTAGLEDISTYVVLLRLRPMLRWSCVRGRELVLPVPLALRS